MINWIRKLLTGLDKSELAAMKEAVKVPAELKKYEDMENLLKVFPAAVYSATVHSREIGEHANTLMLKRDLYKAMHEALKFYRDNPKDFTRWYNNHARKGETFFGDALREYEDYVTRLETKNDK